MGSLWSLCDIKCEGGVICKRRALDCKEAYSSNHNHAVVDTQYPPHAEVQGGRVEKQDTILASRREVKR